MFAAQFTDLGTFPTWALALIAGGGTAAAISSGFAGTRAASTATTGGLGNLVATTETAGAGMMTFFSFSSSRNCVFGSDCPCYCSLYFRKENLEVN